MIFAGFTSAFAGDITLYSNGNPVSDNKYSSGVLTAESEGEGIFAIARYKNDELIDLSVAESYKNVGMAVDGEEDVTVKIFRFLPDGTPFCVNKTPVYMERAEKRIYANENFNNGTTRIAMWGPTVNTIENDKLKIIGVGARTQTVPVFEADKYVIAEATFSLPDINAVNANLINIYRSDTETVHELVTMKEGNGLTNKGGIYTKDSSEIKKYGWSTDKSELATGITISVVINTEDKTYDTYFNHVIKDRGASLTDAVGEIGNTFSFIFGQLKSGSAMYIDDMHIYSANDGSLMDLGDEIPNVHRADFPSDRLKNEIYKRPDYKTIASLTSAKSHPRIMINDAKIAEIKNSQDPTIQRWTEKILDDAEALMGETPYNYKLVDVTSIDGVSEGLDRVMTLGMAYNLTGLEKYTDRAYSEVMKLNENFPNWGNRKALSVGEASVIHAVCYDWMYDALTTEEKNNLKSIIMKQSIIPTYKTYHGQSISDISVDKNRWWDNTNNWNTVCNGGFLIASLAFMEADMYTCSNLAEACLRGLEYTMSVFAPGGAWAEGVMYWGYAMKYLTAAMASLETCCGSLYGIDEAEGFRKTPLYGLSLEGKTGALNFGDASSDHVKSPFMFYWSRVYKEKEYTAAAIYSMEKFGFNADVFALIYYDPKMNDTSFLVPKSYYFEGTEVVSFTSGPSDNAALISMSGGLGHDTLHGHLDSGTVIVEKNGERLFRDIGAEHYEAGGYSGIDTRYKLFRARPEAHNIFIINPEKITDTDNTTEYYGQYINANSPVTYDKANETATMDLSAAYARDVSKASRTIALSGDDVIITDSMTLKQTGNKICWNWYIMAPEEDIVISDDGRSAEVTLNGKRFNISFEASCSYTLDVGEAVQYVDTEPDDGTKRHPNDDYRRLVVTFENASGDVSLKTIIK